MAAYSIYRAKVENDLFENQSQHSGALGIASAVDSGLADYVASSAFTERIGAVHVPHPFDSHPPLGERLQAVGAPMGMQDYAAVAVQVPASNWTSEIVTADAIEGRLWSAFDQAFAAQHERTLAYRYQPANDTERPGPASERRAGGSRRDCWSDYRRSGWAGWCRRQYWLPEG